MSEDMENKTIVVWFSCGAASAVAAKLTLEKYSDCNNVIVANNPVKEEHPDNIRFKKDVEKWLGCPVIEAKNDQYPDAFIVEIFDKRKYMSGNKGAPCTVLLKKEARYQFEKNNNIDYHVLGFTADEKNRYDRFVLAERPNTLPILIEAGYTKDDCFEKIKQAGIILPWVYKHFPNANYIGCVKASSATYWNKVREVCPDEFQERAEQSRRLGCKLVRVKGKRIFLDELDPSQMGGKMRSYDCGIFCDIY